MSQPDACQGELVALAAVDGELRAQWERLASSAAEPNPFFEPQLLLPAGRHLPGGREVRLLVVRRGGELVLALPVRLERHRRIPLPAWTTWRHPYCYLGTPLVAKDALADAPAAALAALGRSHWLALEQLHLDGPVARAFCIAAGERSGRWQEYDVRERPMVQRRPTATYLDGTLSARSAKSLRRLRRNLGRDVGEPVRTWDAAAQPEAEVRAFLELEAQGWKGREGTALASRPADEAFFREASAGFAAAGRLELWRLDAGTQTAARQCHVVSGNTVFHLKTAYAEPLARYSPGVLLELDVLDAFHADPRLALLDPCTGDEPTVSERLYPDRRRLGVALVGLSPLGRLAARGTPVAAAAWRRLQT